MSTADTIRGRVALVTGGSGGIGAAICRALASEGAKVAVGYGTNASAADRLAGEIGGQAFPADLGDVLAPAKLVDDVQSALGPLEILVLNHGVGRQVAYEDVDAETFDRTLAINLRAPFLVAQAALPGMRERGFGRIVFMSSLAAFTGGIVGPEYAASKAGLNALTHFLATRVAGDGVTVNAIAPGLIRTEMLPGDPAELSASVPVGRVGEPEEVADLTVAIVRNGYMNSAVVNVDGGRYAR